MFLSGVTSVRYEFRIDVELIFLMRILINGLWNESSSFRRCFENFGLWILWQ